MFSLQFRYNIEQEQKLATETTVLVEQYTVSTFFYIIRFIGAIVGCTPPPPDIDYQVFHGL